MKKFKINPIDYYNQNHADDALKLFERKNKTVEKLGLGKYTIRINKDDNELFFTWKDNYLNVIEDNPLDLPKDAKLSPFEILCRYQFSNNYWAAINHISIYLQENISDYVRIGVKYFKKINKTDRYGIIRTELKLWNKEEIKQDLGKEALSQVQLYDDFTLVPSNTEFKEAIGKNYNLYSPFAHNEEKYKSLDDIKWSLILMKHIFGEHYELGLQYMKIAYMMPWQALPILSLVSDERQTGKSTYIDWQHQLFGQNSVTITPQDIKSDFNISYATKNIICIEESKFENVQATEKLKALATLKIITVNGKFLQPFPLPFFSKIVITSNDRDKFIKIDAKEIRYWVREVPSLKGKGNHNILEDLVKEIPYFLWYLKNEIEMPDLTLDRQVFTAEMIATEALQGVKDESQSQVYKDLSIHFDQFCMDNEDRETIYFTATDVKQKWFGHDNSKSVSYIEKVLKSEMELTKLGAARYRSIFTDKTDEKKDKLGRCYYIANKYFGDKRIDEPDPQGDIPF